MRNPLIVLALLASFGGSASAQVFNPPPIKSAAFKKGNHYISGELGLGVTSGLDIDVSGGDLDFDYDVMPALDLAWLYGIEERWGLGAQFYIGTLDFDESGLDSENTWTLDVTGAYQLALGEGRPGALFAGFGLTDETGLHFRLGYMTDFEVAPAWTVSPYLQLAYGDYPDNDVDLTGLALRPGASIQHSVQDNLSVIGDVALEWQSWDLDAGGGVDGDGNGFGFCFFVGVQFTLAQQHAEHK